MAFVAVAVARVVYSAAWSAESELQPYWQLVEHSTVRMQGIKFRKAVVTLKGHRMFPPPYPTYLLPLLMPLGLLSLLR